LAKHSTRIGLDLANHIGDRVFGGNHHHHMNMVRLNAVVFNLHIRMMVLDIEQPLFQVELQLPLEDAFAILGNPDDMVLVMVGPMGTESDIHALNIQPGAGAGLFQPAAGNPFTRGLTPGVLRVIVDRKILTNAVRYFIDALHADSCSGYRLA